MWQSSSLIVHAEKGILFGWLPVHLLLVCCENLGLVLSCGYQCVVWSWLASSYVGGFGFKLWVTSSSWGFLKLGFC